MAYNFRPKSVKEILAKKKAKSVEAAQIYEAIMDKYGEGIILDPATSFNKIKIPRTVGEKDNITDIKTFLKTKKKINITGIEISLGSGSGSGIGISAVETAQQENTTRLYCQTYMDTSKFPTVAEIKKIYPKVNDEWFATFEAQAIAITKWIGSTGYEFSRDDGIMPHVEDIALKKCGVATKDSWNPADIYAVKKIKKAKIMKDLTDIGNLNMSSRDKLDKLNSYMRSKITSKELIGISLKKLTKGKVKTLELSNTSKKEPLDDIEIITNSINLNLDLNANNEFQTGEMSLALKIKGTDVAVQIRAFSGGVRESTQMDMTGKGAAAKLGKVSAREAIDPFIKPLSLSRRMGTALPKVGGWTESDIKQYIAEYDKIKTAKIGSESIKFGNDNWEKTLRRAIVIEQDNARTASQLSAKLQCFEWVKIFVEIDKKNKLKEFLTVLYYGAKKEYDSAGPFLKVA
jgi:hypothetical protein